MEEMPFAPTGHANSLTLNPQVEPDPFDPDQDGNWVVTVHQVVHDLKGNLLLDTTVYHTYQFREGLIARMDIALRPRRRGQNA